MKRTELDKLFTAKVTEYISKGFTIYTETMAGHQGEVAKIDLTNGSEIIRIYCEKEYDAYGSFPVDFDGFTITVGRVPEDYDGGTIWTNKLEIIEKQEFVKVSKRRQQDWYITKEEFEENKIAEKVDCRLQGETSKYITKFYKMDSKYNKAVLSFVKRQPGCKSVALKDIEVFRDFSENGTYLVKARGHRFNLK